MENNTISPKQRTGIFLTLIVGTFVTAMSTTVTANMIPNFTEYFGVSANLAQWLTSGATLISGIIIPVTAFLLKKVPNKIYFFATMLAYTLGSLFAFLAQAFPVLLVSRLVQAVGCGMMIPFGQIMLLNLYPAEKHGRVMAAFSMASMVSTVVGPTYAGLMLEAVGWRGVFASLFVFGLVLIVVGSIFMKNIIPRTDAELNVGYVLLSAVGFTTLLIGVSNMGSGSVLKLTSGGLMLIGVISLAIFSRLQLTSKKPMLNLRVFKKASFLIAVVISICLYLIAMGTGVILPIFTKSICGFSDSAYGYATLVGSILAVFTTLYAGRIYDKMGIKPMFFAGIILFAVYSVMGICFSENTGIIYIAVTFALQTIAMSVLNSPATTMALSKLTGNIRIDGSAVFNTIRQISSSLASTLSVLIYTLAGSDINAIHIVYVYYGIVTVAIIVSVLLYLKAVSKLE
ncbi:MFS transporter [Bariatricus sp. SGI.154]|uniref:MFS transporter n=1 Tax=Bariatricus sp. SGI.154 TaxID=3420549 RepID=UPI003D020432